MWKRLLTEFFKGHPAQQRVAQTMLSWGLRVRDGRILCGEIEIPFSKMARAVGVDRRAVMMTVKTIESSGELKKIFSLLQPTCSFRELAPEMGWGVVEIIPSDASMPGILADVASILAEEGISIRQANVDDYVLAEEPRLFIVTEKTLPGGIIKKLKKAKGVKGVTVY